MPSPPASDFRLDLLATAVLMLDGRGRIDYANPAAENLFELSRQKLDGISAAGCLRQADALLAAIERATATARRTPSRSSSSA